MDFLQRILVGDAPWAFLAEVVVRAIAVYAMLLISMRLMGKRVAAQLSITELAVILMLGAAIGVPIQVSSQGVLPAVVVLLTVVCLQRASSRAAVRWRRVEIISQGDARLVVRDGRMLLDSLKQNQMSREMLASELRAADVAHLGELRRVYFEASGALSIIKRKTPLPGLTMRPDMERALLDDIGAEGYFACWSCGNVIETEEPPVDACVHRGSRKWGSPVRGQN